MFNDNTLSEAGIERCSIADRTILVTGAGGSIGSQLVERIAKLRPLAIVLVDLSELNLYKIDLHLARVAPRVQRVPLILNIRDPLALRRAFQAIRPDIVFHVAALKHVPMLESEHNLIEAVLTNLGGTINLAEACEGFDSTMVLISTDKAVNPISNMGRTKRLAEIFLQGFAEKRNSSRYLQVRFGNVMGSSGSVLPLFQSQISAGGPVTVTHPAMTRFMITIDEAVGLVLQAYSHHQRAGQQFAVYVLDMGEPVAIIDLARRAIVESGRTDIEIIFVGVRPGEKLTEELHYPWEVLRQSGVPRVNWAIPEFPAAAQLDLLYELMRFAEEREVEAVSETIAILLAGQGSVARAPSTSHDPDIYISRRLESTMGQATGYSKLTEDSILPFDTVVQRSPNVGESNG